ALIRSIEPPKPRTIPWTTASPRPWPADFVVKNGSNTLACVSSRSPVLLRRLEQLTLGSESLLQLGGDQLRLLRNRNLGLTRGLEIHPRRRDDLSCGIVDRQGHIELILLLFNEGAVGLDGR